MTQTVTIDEAQNRLQDLVANALSGNEVIIFGKVVAMTNNDGPRGPCRSSVSRKGFTPKTCGQARILLIANGEKLQNLSKLLLKFP